MKKLICGFFLFFLFLTVLKAQNIENNLEVMANRFPQERIYLHYDKSSYAPGETVWFKTYIMQAIYPSDDSKTVYIDWSDQNGKLLLHTLSPVLDGTAFGQFSIPENFSGKYIHVKAYTKWMLNFDSSFLYEKDIRILSDSISQAHAIVIKPELNFFPEGGDVIAGVTNKIAFIANDQFGRPIKIKGEIKSSKGEVAGDLTVIHDGMGFFFLRPENGATFTAYWKDEKGASHTTPLPDIKNSGASLQVTIIGNKRNFLVTASPDSKNIQSVHIIGTMYQQPVFNIVKDIKDGTAEGIVPTQSLPSGILTITVFDAQWRPLAERITYVNNEEYLFQPQMDVQHWGLNKRAKNEIEITVPDSLYANLSVSVTDIGIDHDTSDNIISHLLLTGELKGKVNDPAYYFLNNDDSTMQQLDLVMLTHGWRRFDWEKIAAGEFPVIKYPRDTSYMTLSGKVYGATPSQLAAAGAVILMVNQKNVGLQVLTVPVSPNGYFNDSSVLIFDTARVYYQFPKKHGLSDVSVQFMPGRLPPFTNNAKASGSFANHLADTTGNHYHIQMNDALERELKYFKGKVLATVTVKARPTSPTAEMDKKYTSGLFSGGDAHEFDLVNDPFAASSMDIFQYLQGKVAGLQINSTSNPPSLSWRGGTPQVYVDEIPTTTDMVSSVPVSDVAYIKVFPPPFMGGFGGGSGGAIAIYTRKGGDRKEEPGKGLSNNSVSGYTAIRQFYSPNYETISDDNDKKDLRTTLYWNPNVVTTPGKNKVILTFFNNDFTNGFRVIIEGMTAGGKLAHVEQLME